MNSSSYLKKKKYIEINYKLTSPNKIITKVRETELKFYDSRIKQRQLPKLMRLPTI